MISCKRNVDSISNYATKNVKVYPLTVDCIKNNIDHMSHPLEEYET